MSIAAIAEARKLKLDPREKAVVMALADYADDEGFAWPKQRTIADWTGYKRATVNLALADLEKRGYIRSEQQYRDDGGKANKRYYLSFLDRMHEFPLTDDAKAREAKKLHRRSREE